MASKVRKEVPYEDIMGYASPLVQSVSLLIALLFIHGVITTVIFCMTLVTDLFTEQYFYACKSFHPFLPFFGVHFASLAYQKSLFEMTKRMSFLNGKMFLTLVFCFALVVIDCVFFGIDAAPTLVKCYDDLVAPSPQCDTNERRISYTIHVVLRIAHIVIEVLIFAVTLWTKYSSHGDVLYKANPRKYEKEYTLEKVTTSTRGKRN